jgi:hypothetical protein
MWPCFQQGHSLLDRGTEMILVIASIKADLTALKATTDLKVAG